MPLSVWTPLASELIKAPFTSTLALPFISISAAEILILVPSSSMLAPAPAVQGLQVEERPARGVDGRQFGDASTLRKASGRSQATVKEQLPPLEEPQMARCSGSVVSV